MKNYPNSKTISIISLVFILLLNYPQVFGGDAFIYKYNFRNVWYSEKEDSVEVTFKNEEAFDVPNFSVNYSIYQETSPLNWELKFEWTKADLTIPANSEVEIKSDIMWKPLLKGRFQLRIDSYSASDIDLSNNSLNHDFIVGDFKYLKLKQFNFKNPFQIENSTLGRVMFKLPPKLEEDGISFINVIAQKPETTNNDWIVRNLPIAPFEDYHRLNYYFDFAKLGYTIGEDVDSLDIAVQEDTVPLTLKFDPLSWIRFGVYDSDYNIKSDNGHGNDTNPSIPLAPSPPVYDSFPGYEYYYIGCNLPNIELDSSANKVSGDYAGDWNACGPAAASNSIHWLEETNPDIPSTGSSHRDKMKEISELMERGNEDGVTTRQLVKGKLGYIDKHKLPIHVKYQSWWESGDSIASPDTTYGHSAENKSDSVGKQKPPTWEFLMSELKKGEDVEILFGWYDVDAGRHGGHWVALSGFFDSEFMKGIYFKDDGSQGDSTGTRETFIEWKQDGDWSRLVGFDGPNNYCWVESVVSESYDSTVKFDTPTNLSHIWENNNSTLIVYNNPSRLSESVFIEYNLEKLSEVKVEVYTLNGKILKSYNLGVLISGKHNFELKASEIKKRGNYLVAVKAHKTIMASQIVKY